MALSGPLQVDDRVQLTDSKNRHFTVILEEDGKSFIRHSTTLRSDLIGAKEGTTVTSGKGTVYLAMRHLLVDYVLSMPCGAAVIYPKGATQAIVEGNIFPGARVLEASVGSGALSLNLLRAIGADGQLISYEAREDHIEHAGRNVVDFMNHKPGNRGLRLGDLDGAFVRSFDDPADRVILDMLAPWECLDTVSKVLQPGGVLMIHIATVPQLMRATGGIRARKCFIEPRTWGSLVRGWNVQGPFVRPAYRMQARTAFLV